MLRVSYCDSHLSVVCQCVNFFIQTTSPLKPLIGFWPNFTGTIPRCSSTKVVQTIPVGCIRRSPSHKIGFQNAILKNLLVWNYKAQSFHIWYIASVSRWQEWSLDGPLPKLFKWFWLVAYCRSLYFRVMKFSRKPNLALFREMMNSRPESLANLWFFSQTKKEV